MCIENGDTTMMQNQCTYDAPDSIFFSWHKLDFFTKKIYMSELNANYDATPLHCSSEGTTSVDAPICIRIMMYWSLYVVANQSSQLMWDSGEGDFIVIEAILTCHIK